MKRPQDARIPWAKLSRNSISRNTLRPRFAIALFSFASEGPEGHESTSSSSFLSPLLLDKESSADKEADSEEEEVASTSVAMDCPFSKDSTSTPSDAKSGSGKVTRLSWRKLDRNCWMLRAAKKRVEDRVTCCEMKKISKIESRMDDRLDELNALQLTFRRVVEA